MSDRAQSKGWPQSAITLLIGPSGLSAECWLFAKPDGLPVEYPGYGKRERREGWTHQTMAQEIVDSHDGPLDVLGVSTGGAIVAHLLMRHSERIRSAIIICSDCAVNSEETEQAARRIADIQDQARIVLKDGMQAVVEHTMARWFSPFALRADLPGVRYARETLLKTNPEVWRDSAMAEVKSERVPLAALKTVTQSVTIVGGMHDHAGSLRKAMQFHSMIPNSRYEIWPASPMVHLEQPEFIQAILDRHRIWAPTANRVEPPLGTCVWLNTADGPLGSIV